MKSQTFDKKRTYGVIENGQLQNSVTRNNTSTEWSEKNPVAQICCIIGNVEFENLPLC